MILAMSGMMHDPLSTRGREYEPTPTPKSNHVPKGCQEYEFGGVLIVARNRENAEKKARKRGLI